MGYLTCRIKIDNFEELKKYEELIVNEILLIDRTQEVWDKYQEHQREQKVENKDYGEIIRTNVMKGQKDALTPDKFPKDLPEDTAQYLLWIDEKEISDEEFERILDKYLKQLNLTKNEVICFEKSPNNRTVPEVRHWHIYAKKK